MEGLAVFRLVSADLCGIEGRAVDVEVDLIAGLGSFVISGLPGKGIRESRERIRSAIQNSGLRYPSQRRIVVNLAPAGLEKDGATFDLPIALGVLVASGQIDGAFLQGCAALGELALDGSLRAIPGSISLVDSLTRIGIERILLPVKNLREGRLCPGDRCHGVRDLRHSIAVLRGESEGVEASDPIEVADLPPPELADVIGLERGKRALAIAATGAHDLLLVGPPGTGKSLLARHLPALLPAPDGAEVFEIARIASATGHRIPPVTSRPYRAPHHTVSWAGLVGGGSPPMPGEVTLAHRGVLFLDELPEFQRRAIDALREPLEEGQVTIARSGGVRTFPARFQLVSAMNPCPCGFAGSARRACRCPPARIQRYLEGVSGPFLDRIDLRVVVEGEGGASLLRGRKRGGLTTSSLRETVREGQRFRQERGQPFANRGIELRDRERWAPLEPAALRLLESCVEERFLSTRALLRLLRVARSCADLDFQASIGERHLLEALDLRCPQGQGGFLTDLIDL